MKKINKDLREIADILNIPSITFYTTRHTPATTMKRNGGNENIISQAFGHSNVEVTQYYLSKFENEVLDNVMNSL